MNDDITDKIFQEASLRQTKKKDGDDKKMSFFHIHTQTHTKTSWQEMIINDYHKEMISGDYISQKKKD